MKTLKQILQEADDLNNPTTLHKAVKSAFWAGLSQGQEQAESKIRHNIATLPTHRYKNIQSDTVTHILKDNPCAVAPPILPSYAEIMQWIFDV